MEYIYLFYDLATSGLPIIVFTDPSLVSKFRIFPSTVHVVGVPLNTFELYNIGMSYNGELPTKRNQSKDTREFLSIMNTKSEFIVRAGQIFPEIETFFWIDFGILKIVHDREKFLKKLSLLQNRVFTHITLPGCWEFGRGGFTVDSVNWRFCGGFFIMPRQYIQTWYTHCKNVLTDFCTLPIYKLTWETNVWVIVELYASGAKDFIQWYKADHDDSIIIAYNSS